MAKATKLDRPNGIAFPDSKPKTPPGPAWVPKTESEAWLAFRRDRDSTAKEPGTSQDHFFTVAQAEKFYGVPALDLIVALMETGRRPIKGISVHVSFSTAVWNHVAAMCGAEKRAKQYSGWKFSNAAWAYEGTESAVNGLPMRFRERSRGGSRTRFGRAAG